MKELLLVAIGLAVVGMKAKAEVSPDELVHEFVADQYTITQFDLDENVRVATVRDTMKSN